VKAEVEGGLDQISVEGLVLMVNSGGGIPLPGTGSLVLTKWNCDEDIAGLDGMVRLRLYMLVIEVDSSKAGVREMQDLY